MTEYNLMAMPQNALMAILSIILMLAIILFFIFRKPMPKNAKYASLGIIVAIIGLFTFTVIQSYSSKLVVFDDKVIIDIPLYSQNISRQELLLEDMFYLSKTEDAFTPKWRRNGLGLPGYLLGWFELENGQRALVSAANMEHVIVIPTTQGFSVMLSVQHPKLVLEELQMK